MPTKTLPANKRHKNPDPLNSLELDAIPGAPVRKSIIYTQGMGHSSGDYYLDELLDMTSGKFYDALIALKAEMAKGFKQNSPGIEQALAAASTRCKSKNVPAFNERFDQIESRLTEVLSLGSKVSKHQKNKFNLFGRI
jgi:hypothetical protein